jgi:hypothetical protein
MAIPINIPFTFDVGQPVIAAQHNANNTEIANFVTQLQNGQNYGTGVIGTATIANGAIGTSQLADAGVTSAKLQASIALTTPNIGAAEASSIRIGTVTGLATPTNGALVQGNVVYHLAINPQAASYILALSDDGKLIEISSSLAATVTIPLNASVAFPLGTQITVMQTGTGQITFVPTSGVVLNSNPGTKTRGIWTAATLIKRALPDTWVLVGDLAV